MRASKAIFRWPATLLTLAAAGAIGPGREMRQDDALALGGPGRTEAAAVAQVRAAHSISEHEEQEASPFELRLAGQTRHSDAQRTPIPVAPPLALNGTAPSMPVVRDGFRSIQVNVDHRGRNILGDAANEPSIAIDPTDPRVVVIGFRQFNTVEAGLPRKGFAYSHDAGHTWVFAGVLDPSRMQSDPVLGSSPDGTIYFHGTTWESDRTFFRSFDRGVTWDDGIFPFNADKPWMTVDHSVGIGRGNVYLIGATRLCRSTDGGESFEEPVAFTYSDFPTASVGPDGTLYIVGSKNVLVKSNDAQAQSANITFSTSHFDLGTLPPGGAPNVSGLVGQFWVATDHSGGSSRGNLYVLGNVYNPWEWNGLDVAFARSEDQGASWNPRQRVNDDVIGNDAWQWFGMMSVAPNGRIDAVWNDTRNYPDEPWQRLSELYYSYSTDAGDTWSQNVPVSPVFNRHVGFPAGSPKLGDYYHMLSDNLGVNVAWAATFNGEQDIYFLRIGPWDCNGNEIPDDCDIDCDAPGCSVPVCDAKPDPRGAPDFLPDRAEHGAKMTSEVASRIHSEPRTSVRADVQQPSGAQPIDETIIYTLDDAEIVSTPTHFPGCIGNGAYTGIDGYLSNVEQVCGRSLDCNANGVPDECEFRGDIDGDGVTTLSDLAVMQRCYTGRHEGTEARRHEGEARRHEAFHAANEIPKSTSSMATQAWTMPPGLYSVERACCSLFDLEPDGDVDLEDFTAIQRVHFGP